MDTLNDVISGLKWGKLEPIEAHDRIEVLSKSGTIEFALWLQDNYSTNKKQGESYPLAKGLWRLDFTDDIYTIDEIYDKFKTI